MFAQELANTLVQLAIALAVAGGAWFAFARKSAPFRQWIGLTRPAAGWIGGTLLVMIVAFSLSALMMAFTPLGELATGEGTVAGRFAETGLTGTAIATILLVAIVKTGLTEEIVFRGLIGKRLIDRFGFAAGNAAQALLFGAIHLALFAAPGAPEPTPVFVATIFVLPTLAGWLMGYANHRFGNGSIVPGWLIHAVGNMASYTLFAA